MSDHLFARQSSTVQRQANSTQGRLRRTLTNICAFTNDLPGNGRPGVVLVGVRDNGSCASLPIDDELLVRLSNIRGEGSILPLPSMTVQRRRLNECEVAVVTVEPSASPPVRYQGRVWVRVGPSVHEGSAEDERLLGERRRAADLPFDSRPADGMEIEDLDPDFLRSHYFPAAVATPVLESNQRTFEQQLRSLRLVHGGRPTWGATLAFGRDPQGPLPGAYVQFLRIDGTEITDSITQQKQLTGRLDDVIRRLNDLLDLSVSVRTKVAGTRREVQQPDYPVDALRQLVYNAVMHRSYEGTNTPIRVYWYSDRVEIANPGGLYGRMTSENFGKGDTDYRNPLLAEIMHSLGFAQRFGLGVPLARKLLAENGNPKPEFHFEPTRVVATVRAVP